MIDPLKLSRAGRPHKPRLYRPAARRRAALGLSVLLLAACAERAPMLNSERIEAAYGSYGVEVLESSAGRRVTNLYSTDDGRRTTRTYAEVRFRLPVDEALLDEHALIVAGGSIGRVFKSRGWTISKRNLRIASDHLDGASGQAIARLMRIDAPREVARHEYAFVVSRDGGRQIDYAVITESHHPDYLDEADLRRIYGHAPKTAK